MRQSNHDCVAIFLSARRHGQGSQLAALPAGADYTDGESHVRAALDPAKQVLDLFDGVHVGLANAVNNEPASYSRFIRRAARFDSRDQNAASLRVPKRVTQFLAQILKLHPK